MGAMILMVSLGQRIREVRIKKGLTQIDCAQGICTPSMISQIESDRARPSYKMLTALATRLEVSVDKLLENVQFNFEYTTQYKMAMAMVAAGEYQSAIAFLEELVKMPIPQLPTTPDIPYELGVCYLKVGRDEQAVEMFDQVLRSSTLTGDHHKLASALYHLGRISIKRKEYRLAYYNTQRALEEVDKLDVHDASLRAQCLFQQASVYQEIGKVEEAVRGYKQALEHFAGCGEVEEISHTFLQLSRAYQKRKDFGKANEYAKLALSIQEAHSDTDVYQDIRRQLIVLEQRSHGFQESVAELLTFVERYQGQADTIRVGETYADIAVVCMDREQWVLAEDYAKKVIMSLPFNHEAVGRANRILAYVYFALGQPEQARQYLDNAIIIFEQLGRVAELEEVTRMLCRYLDGQGRHREAFERLTKYHVMLAKQLGERGIDL